jgi:LacI family transcriptional regulator
MLAEHLSLSQGTVSRALNEYPDISKSTRSRVRKAANAMGYVPNPTARRLATGVAEVVAYVMPERHGGMSESFIAPLLQGLGDSLSDRGWDLLVTQAATPDDEIATLKRLTTARQVSGVVLSRPRKKDPRVDFLRNAGFPFVVHGRTDRSSDYAWYDVDSKAAFADAVGRLIALGHRRIGFVGAPMQFTFAQMRADGYADALAGHGIDYDAALVVIAALSEEAGESATQQLLDLVDPPTAVLCTTDTQALGALSALRSRSLVPGKDVSLVGYDGLSIGRHTNPPLTTMAQPQADSGRRLGEMLLAIIDGGNPADFQELHAAEFLRRETDGPVPAEPARKPQQKKTTGETI